MRPLQLVALTLTLTLLSNTASAAKKQTDGVTMPMKYEGGSLNFDPHNSLKTTISQDRIIVQQGKMSHTIAVKDLTEISYGNDVHRRVGAAVGVGVVTLGLGALLLLVKTKKHYVGIVWAEKPSAAPAVASAAAPAGGDAPKASKGGVVFKVGKGEYRGFIAALEGVSGLKAVNADVAGPGGTSGTAASK